jgi:negative regulator of flagellin synthesis FlgM
MKIHDSNGLQLNKLYRAQADDKKAGKAREEEKRTADTLAISTEAAQLREAVKEAARMEEVRTEKVAELREALEKGTFQTDSDKLAAAMLRQRHE